MTENRMNRRCFFSRMLMLILTAAAASAGGGAVRKSPENKLEVSRTSRKRADHYRELAG